MAVILAITYQKKLGLPNYSSHSCQVSLTVEIPDVSVVAQETTKLYQLLQAAVDQEIQQVGFMPDATVYGMNRSESENANGNGHHAGSNGTSGTNCTNRTNGTATRGYRSTRPAGNGDAWNCTEGQQGFIIRLVNESNLEKNEVEKLAQELFGAGVKQLDKMQASQLIEELLEKTGKKTGGKPHWRRQPARS